MEKPKITVLGIGNRLMMDDGIGIIIVEELMKEIYFNRIEYVIGESDIEFSFDVIQQSDFTIIIDAMNTGNKIGEVSLIPFKDIATQKLGVSPHDQHLFFSISQDHQLKGMVIGIEVSEISYHYGLSSILLKELPRIKKEILGVLEEFLQ